METGFESGDEKKLDASHAGELKKSTDLAVNWNEASMELIYCFIAVGEVIVEHPLDKDGISKVAMHCLKKLPADSSKSICFLYDGHCYNFLREEDYVFLLVTVGAAGAMPFFFLKSLRRRFVEWYEAEGHNVGELHELGPWLKICMQRFMDTKGIEKLMGIDFDFVVSNCFEKVCWSEGFTVGVNKTAWSSMTFLMQLFLDAATGTAAVSWSPPSQSAKASCQTCSGVCLCCCSILR